MTRKDFNLIAEALVGTRPDPGQYYDPETQDRNLAFVAHKAQWQADREAIAQALDNLNEAFDIDRFVEATER